MKPYIPPNLRQFYADNDERDGYTAYMHEELCKTEVEARWKVNKMFTTMDANHDGVISFDEYWCWRAKNHEGIA